MTSNPPVAAIFNTSPDTVELLRLVLEREGFVVVGVYTYALRDGKVDINLLIKQHHPDVIIYDIAPPYEKNWREFLHVRSMEAFRGMKFLVTTTNARHVQAVAGDSDAFYEIVGKPYDLGLIVDAVKKLVGRS